ncbi:MAG: glycosyltransferase, partial [Calditrichia bacterium]|nr:glycosyltransferase [Calditrichia bacterium]
MSTICYVTISPVIHERRNLNQMKLLQEMGHKGIMIALWEKGLPEKETVYSTEIIRLKIRNPEGGKIKFLEFNYKVYKLLKKLSFDLLHIHELWPLPGSVLAVKGKNIPTIYDAHEFFMGIEIFNQKKKEKWIWYLAEKMFTPAADALITVSEPHRRIYNLTYKHFLKKDTMVIHNVPEKVSAESLKIEKDMKLPERYIVFQGLFRPKRGIIPMLKSMKYIDDGTVLLLCGYGELEEEMKKIIKKENLENRIQFHGKFNPDEILPITANALAGIVLFEPTSINYRYAMPNKFFEYIQAETPLVASNL